ncbi:MAG TPA: serine/threonine-protein kinase [Kofleriaceae bacterium]|nr:serine/threonine-protein kinase [Kofleriaceae bacterium]
MKSAKTYVLLERLASGGMADIFLAREIASAGLVRHCVVKRIRRDCESDARYVQLFHEEMRIVSRLQHPNIPHVLDIGRIDGSSFMAMEYVHGVTLGGLLGRARAASTMLPLSTILPIAAGIACALQHVHDRGVVHHDVSLSNVMVTFDGHVKLIDFGIASTRNDVCPGMIKGKPAYMAPERRVGALGDERSDLFSLGVVLWELLCQMRLAPGDSVVPPSTFRPMLPVQLDHLVAALLADDPEARHASASCVLDSIERIARHTSTLMTPTSTRHVLHTLFGATPEPWTVDDRTEVYEQRLAS